MDYLAQKMETCTFEMRFEFYFSFYVSLINLATVVCIVHVHVRNINS